ncbi:MAG: hypothetical protein ACI84C_000854 [Flavobacteriales bacterium]|jgi:hypothetical protein
MKNLGIDIGQLLYLHDCVIVPGFGGFVGNEVGARINTRQKTIAPPSKFISFNKNLTHNDGLLANALARRYKLTYDEAVAEIETLVASFKGSLADGLRVELESVGALYMSQDGRMHFIVDEKMNFLTSAFGLGTITLPQHVVAVKPETGETKVVALPIEIKVDDKEDTPRKRRGLWIAAAAVVLPLIAATGYIYLKGNPGGKNINFASLNPFSSHEISSVYQPRFEEEAVIFNYPEDENSLEKIAQGNPLMSGVYFSFIDDKVSPEGVMVKFNDAKLNNNLDVSETLNSTLESTLVEVNPAVEVRPNSSLEAATSMELYFIVGGAFKQKSNAEGLVNSLKSKGFDASIFGHKRGLHLVCYGSYTNKKAAKEALKEIKSSQNKSAWLSKN